MTPRRRYYRLTLPEREHLSRLLGAGCSTRAMARAMGRPPSTLSRELRRLGPSRGSYWATPAHAHAWHHAAQRHRVLKLAGHPALRTYVFVRLRQGWSPAQIARRLRKEYPQDMTMRVAHETIYRYLYILPRGALYASRRLVDTLGIDARPPKVAARTVPGHWEGDLLLGTRHSPAALGTLVERMTRFTVLVRVPRWDARTIGQAFAQRLRQIPTPLAKTLTYDNGSEMAGHRAFTAATAVQVYFCHPHSPWE